MVLNINVKRRRKKKYRSYMKILIKKNSWKNLKHRISYKVFFGKVVFSLQENTCLDNFWFKIWHVNVVCITRIILDLLTNDKSLDQVGVDIL